MTTARSGQSRTSLVLVLGLFVFLLGAVASTSRSEAQVLPPPPTVPAPPEEGNPLSDILGPTLTSNCDAVAVVFALAGPIATAQIPPELQPVVRELEPYIGTALVACGFIATPPTGTVCEADASSTDLFAPLGLPVTAPAGAAQFHDTVAGIESAFLRIGVDIDRDTSTQLAEVLGCTVPEAAPLPPPAAAPAAPPPAPSGEIAAPPTAGPVAGPTQTGGFAPVPGVATVVPPVVPSAASVDLPADTIVTTIPVPTGLFWNPLTYLVPLLALGALFRATRTFTAPTRTGGGST